MNTKHTPGPWHVGDAAQEQLTVFDQAGWMVVSIPFSFAPRKAGENVANAYLIAAAPELLESLQEMVELAGGMTLDGPQQRKARSAIAKARGES